MTQMSVEDKKPATEEIIAFWPCKSVFPSSIHVHSHKFVCFSFAPNSHIRILRL